MDNIFPPCSRILALEVMFDGISEHASLHFSSFWVCFSITEGLMLYEEEALSHVEKEKK